jgi:hypothetical protein
LHRRSFLGRTATMGSFGGMPSFSMRHWWRDTNLFLLFLLLLLLLLLRLILLLPPSSQTNQPDWAPVGTRLPPPHPDPEHTSCTLATPDPVVLQSVSGVHHTTGLHGRSPRAGAPHPQNPTRSATRPSLVDVRGCVPPWYDFGVCGCRCPAEGGGRGRGGRGRGVVGRRYLGPWWVER